MTQVARPHGKTLKEVETEIRLAMRGKIDGVKLGRLARQLGGVTLADLRKKERVRRASTARPKPEPETGRWAFTIHGPPRTKKTSNRLVSAGRRRYVLPSAAWTTWCRTARFIFERGAEVVWSKQFLWYRLRRPIAAPVSCRAIFYRDANRGDLVGYMQGLADLLEKRGILKNDRQIVSWDGTRLALDREIPRVEVLLVAPPAAGGGP